MGDRRPVGGVQLRGHTRGADRGQVPVTQHHEPGRYGKLRRYQLAHVGTFAAGFLGVGHAEISDVFDVPHGSAPPPIVSDHAPRLLPVEVVAAGR